MTAPIRPTLPSSLGRTLSPEEFDQAKIMGPDALQSADFPAVPPIQPAKPESDSASLSDQVVGAGQQIWNVLSHPIDAVAALGHGIVDAYSKATAPVIGTKQGSGYALGPHDIAQLEHDLGHPLPVVTKENTPNAVTPTESLSGIGNTAANVLLPIAGGPVASRVANAAIGALNDPQHVRGALTGLALGELIHAGSRIVGGSVASSADALGISEAIKAKMVPVTDAFNKVFDPASRSPEAVQTASILRATTGAQAAAYEQAAYQLDDFRKAIDPLPQADKLAFIDAIEGGKSQPSPAFQESANTIRSLLDNARQQIQDLGTGKLENFIDHYFPHIWADPARATDAFKVADEASGTDALQAAKLATGGKRPMEGSKAFLKQRTLPTTADGIALGLEPVSYNPVDLTLLKLREMQKYVMAHTSLNEMRDAGLTKFVSSGDIAPEGYAKIDDRIATVFGPREGAVSIPDGANITPDQVSVPGMRIMGQHWAPEPVARVVNNYLSPGLKGEPLYDAYRGLGNALNQAQLGLSAFHLGFTSMDAMVSRTALGIEHIASGRPWEGLKDIASTPLAPVTNAMLGAKVRRAYLNPDGASPDMQALANAVKEAGGRVRMDSFYQNSAPQQMIEAWKQGEYGKATALSLPAFFETISKPLMEHIVPMQKLGVFGDLAKKALADLPPEASLLERRQALASAWDSVDNRMGQLVYDNLFWNKTFKDLAMSSVRSVGWNIGTIRELGGGIGDIAGSAADLSAGKSTALTHRAAYVIALPLVTGMLGAAYQYLRTGDGPQELQDYFHPKTGEVDVDGNPERVQLPSYVKDVAAYASHPWETVKHKVAPLPNMVFEMLQNQNYYGDEIRNPNDPAVKQLLQEAQYIGANAMPFALTNMQESKKRGDQSTVTQFGNWFGVTPAARTDVRSPAQNKMADYLSTRKMTGATPEDADARNTRAEILAGLRGQNGIDVQEAVTNAIEHEQLTGADLAKLLKRAGTTPAQEKFKRLTVTQAIEVFKLSSPEEQAKFADALRKKIERAAPAATEDVTP